MSGRDQRWNSISHPFYVVNQRCSNRADATFSAERKFGRVRRGQSTNPASDLRDEERVGAYVKVTCASELSSLAFTVTSTPTTLQTRVGFSSPRRSMTLDSRSARTFSPHSSTTCPRFLTIQPGPRKLGGLQAHNETDSVASTSQRKLSLGRPRGPGGFYLGWY